MKDAAVELLLRLERCYESGSPIVDLMVDVSRLLDARAAGRPKKYRCGSCRDRGQWSDGMKCPACSGDPCKP